MNLPRTPSCYDWKKIYTETGEYWPGQILMYEREFAEVQPSWLEIPAHHSRNNNNNKTSLVTAEGVVRGTFPVSPPPRKHCTRLMYPVAAPSPSLGVGEDSLGWVPSYLSCVGQTCFSPIAPRVLRLVSHDWRWGKRQRRDAFPADYTQQEVHPQTPGSTTPEDLPTRSTGQC